MRFYERFIKGQDVDDLWRDILQVRPWAELKKLMSQNSEPLEIPLVDEPLVITVQEE